VFAALGRVVVRNPLVVKRADGRPLTDADVQRTQRLAQQLSSAGIDRVAAAQSTPRPCPPTAGSSW
jgi:hypothetical protein